MISTQISWKQFFALLVLVAIIGVLAGLLIPVVQTNCHTLRDSVVCPNTENGPTDVSPSDPEYYSHRFLPVDVTAPFARPAIEYFQGDGLGRNWALRILPDGRYSFLWTGCLGVYVRESGYAILKDNRLRLLPIVSAQLNIPRDFLSIPWGSRSYLIPPEEMKKFCDSIIDGHEPRNRRHGFFINFYLAGEGQHVDGVPGLPEPWAAYLRKNLLKGKVVDVMKDGQVKIDLGSKEGISIGKSLQVQGYGWYYPRWVSVQTVSEHDCIAEDVARVNELSSKQKDNGWYYPDGAPPKVAGVPLKVGDVVTTRKR